MFEEVNNAASKLKFMTKKAKLIFEHELVSIKVNVCKSFEARILNDQLCYEVDLNKFSHYDSFAEDLKKGLTKKQSAVILQLPSRSCFFLLVVWEIQG